MPSGIHTVDFRGVGTPQNVRVNPLNPLLKEIYELSA